MDKWSIFLLSKNWEFQKAECGGHAVLCCLAQEDRGREDKLATTEDKELRFAILFFKHLFAL